MNRMKSYIALFVLLCLAAIGISTVDIIDYSFNTPAVLIITFIVYVVAFSLIQFKAKISIWEKAISGFLSPYIIYFLSMPALFILNMMPAYVNFCKNPPGDLAGGWLFLIILGWSWFVGTVALIFALIKTAISLLGKIKKGRVV